MNNKQNFNKKTNTSSSDYSVHYVYKENGTSNKVIVSDGLMITYNRKSVGLGSWTDDQAQD